MIDSAFIAKNQEIFDIPQGAGLWLWKSWIILDAMKHSPENAVIIYMDAGFSICGSLEPLFNKLTDTDIILVQHDLDNSAFIFECTKTDILKNEGIDLE